MKLQVMICTLGPKGLARVGQMSLPVVEGVGYLVSCQGAPLALPDSLLRDDVQVVFTPTLGLSNNRNNALDAVTAPYALIADDDLTFFPDGLKEIIRIFDANPHIDIATFKSIRNFNKFFPSHESDLWSGVKNYNVTSFEIALRVESVRRAALQFNPLWGIGAPRLHCAEENIFLLAAKHKQLVARFYPVTIVSHLHDSTGTSECQPSGVLQAHGAYITFAYPLTFLLRLPLKAWRSSGSFFFNLRYILKGSVYAITHKRRLL